MPPAKGVWTSTSLIYIDGAYDGSIAEKHRAMHTSGVSGMMTCWNFGNMASIATEVAGEYSWAPQPPDAATGLRRVAVRHFGEAAAADVVAAWDLLTRAHDDFPSSIPTMYYGPIGRGPAFPFVFDRIDRPFPDSWLLTDDIEGDRSPPLTGNTRATPCAPSASSPPHSTSCCIA